MALISQYIAEDGFQYPIDSGWLSTFGEIGTSIPPIVITEPRYWIASSTSNWTDTASWSLTSGGSGGASIPTTQNVVVFDSSGIGVCNMDSTAYIKGLYVSDYTSTINQNSYEMRIDSSGAIFWSGDFSGSGDNIRVRGDLYIGGVANFVSTDQTLSCDSTFQYYNTANFIHNNGIISLDSSGCMIEAFGMQASTLQFNSDKARVGESLYVENLLILKSGSVRHLTTDGTVFVQGDTSCRSEYNQWTDFNNLSILMDGTQQQRVYNEVGSVLPTLYVDKNTNPQVICDGGSPLRIKGDFLIYDGTFNSNGLNIQVGI